MLEHVILIQGENYPTTFPPLPSPKKNKVSLVCVNTLIQSFIRNSFLRLFHEGLIIVGIIAAICWCLLFNRSFLWDGCLTFFGRRFFGFVGSALLGFLGARFFLCGSLIFIKKRNKEWKKWMKNECDGRFKDTIHGFVYCKALNTTFFFSGVTFPF